MSAAAVAPFLLPEQTQSSATSTRSPDDEVVVREQIANLAYSLGLERRGCPENSADTDWLEAERQVRDGTAK